MSKHLFGSILTGYGIAANNRGETEGNLTTLQKVLWHGETHSTVSAEAIRWAIRYFWQMRAEVGETALETNRRWDDESEDNRWKDGQWSGWANGSGAKTYIDDDVLGFMLAEAAKQEGNEAEEDGEKQGAERTKGRRSRQRSKGTITKRRGVLELTRAVSLSPFVGDQTFNAKSGEKGTTSLYSAEVHATRYQFGFAMTPQRLRDAKRLAPTLEAIAALGEVAGNHSRFLFDFSPESIALRCTDDPAPRMLFSFDEDAGEITIEPLLRRLHSQDIDAREMVVGGDVMASEDLKRKLEGLGVTCFAGVKAAVKAMKDRLEA